MYNINAVDLHMHSNASDGSDAPHELVEKAKALGIKTISITDHDTLDGLISAMRFDGDGIGIITGIEFSCHAYVGDGFDCHILGYGFDVDNEDMRLAIDHGRRMRFAKLEARIKYMRENFGIVFSDAEICELRSYNSVAKPHIARILMRNGLAHSVGDAIEKYLKGAKFPDDRIDAKEAIDAIHAAGGVAVYAHPLGGERERRLTPCELFCRVKALTSLGIDGLEGYYSRYNESDREIILRAARENDMLISAGSDYHGENKTVKLGEISVDGLVVSELDITVLRKLNR